MSRRPPVAVDTTDTSVRRVSQPRATRLDAVLSAGLSHHRRVMATGVDKRNLDAVEEEEEEVEPEQDAKRAKYIEDQLESMQIEPGQLVSISDDLKASLSSLPEDILGKIFDTQNSLSCKKIARLCRLNKAFRSMCYEGFDEKTQTLVWHEPFWQLLCDVRKYSRESRLFPTEDAHKYWDPPNAPEGEVKVPYNGSYRMHYEWWCTRQLQDTAKDKSDEWWKTLLGALEEATSERRRGREHSMLGPVKEWDVSQITDMSSLFDEKRWHTSFDLSQWDVSNVKTMHRMFAGLSAKDKLINISDISKWNVSNVENMNAMFAGFTNFNCDLSGWNVSNVKNMRSMFEGCTYFNSNLSTWKDNVKNVKDMAYMFMSCSQFDSDLSGWEVSNVKDMECMFAYSRINSNLSK